MTDQERQFAKRRLERLLWQEGNYAPNIVRTCEIQKLKKELKAEK